MSPEPSRATKRRSERESWRVWSSERIRLIADQQGSEEGAWCLVVEVEPSEPKEAVSVASEPELVLRVMSAVVFVVAVEVKLRL